MLRTQQQSVSNNWVNYLSLTDHFYYSVNFFNVNKLKFKVYKNIYVYNCTDCDLCKSKMLYSYLEYPVAKVYP